MKLFWNRCKTVGLVLLAALPYATIYLPLILIESLEWVSKKLSKGRYAIGYERLGAIYFWPLDKLTEISWELQDERYFLTREAKGLIKD